MRVSITIDVEKDLHSESYNGLEEGIPRLLTILNKHNIKATFFVPAKLIENFPYYFTNLDKQGHEIALHGYEHERFDDLALSEKRRLIKESVKIYKNLFGKFPRGFRAPQHSIDEKTVEILKQEGFLYDSSETPLNLLQLLF